MKRILLWCTCIVGVLFPLMSEATVTTTVVDVPAVIDSIDAIEVNKNILFDGSRSVIDPNNDTTTFVWDFGDASQGNGREIIHTYTKPGTYSVNLKVRQDTIVNTVTKNIFVYETAQSILTDRAHDTPELHQLVKSLQSKNILANIFLLPETFIGSETNFIDKSTFIFALTDPSTLVSQALRNVVKNKTVILIADGNLQILERLSKNSFSGIGAEKILLTSKDALLPANSNDISILEAKNSAELTGIMTNRKLEFNEINTQEKIGTSNFMLAIINYLRSQGVPDTSLFLLLCIPFIVTIISFFRQFIGIATLGIYTPTIFTIIFLVVGGIVGSSTFIILALVSALLRRILKHVRIMYVPKMALVLIGSTIAMIIMFVMAAFYNYRAFIVIDILPLLLLLTMGERFISLELERGFRSAAFLFLETIVVSLVAYFILDYQKTNILAYPEITLLMIPLNYLFGKWTGLRISEVLRFRDLIDSVEQETEE